MSLVPKGIVANDAARSTAVGKLLTTFWLHCTHRVTSHYGRVMPHNASHG